MKRVIYIARHSKPFRDLLGQYISDESEQIRNEKNPLSVQGELAAKKMSELEELSTVKVLYSSQYVRAMSTAKYIAEKNNIKLNVDSRFGERRFGVNNINELPKDFFEDQFRNWDYKLPDGESLNETSTRIKAGLFDLLDSLEEDAAMIVSHGTALSVMLSEWCNIKLNEETKLIEIYFNNRLVFDGNWKCPELFKLTFENNVLIDIKNIDLGKVRL